MPDRWSWRCRSTRSFIEPGAAAQGSIPRDRVESRVKVLAAAVLAINVVARQSGSAAEVSAIIDGALTMIDDWR